MYKRYKLRYNYVQIFSSRYTGPPSKTILKQIKQLKQWKRPALINKKSNNFPINTSKTSWKKRLDKNHPFLL